MHCSCQSPHHVLQGLLIHSFNPYLHSFIPCMPSNLQSLALQQTLYGSPPACPVLKVPLNETLQIAIRTMPSACHCNLALALQHCCKSGHYML